MRRAVEYLTTVSDNLTQSVALRSDVRIISYVIGTDTEISYFQSLDAMDIESFIEHTVLHNAVAFLGSHGAGSEAVPRTFDMTLHPLFDGLDVFGAGRGRGAGRRL